MNYTPNRLIDPKILTELLQNNPLISKGPTRLLLYNTKLTQDVIPNKDIDISSNILNNKISRIKKGVYKKILPDLINGILFISICLLIYYILYYKYNKKNKNKTKY